MINKSVKLLTHHISYSLNHSVYLIIKCFIW